MDIFSLFMFFGGLALFLYGMIMLSKGLEKLAGGKLERTLRSLTSNKFKALLLGAGTTMAIQSSSAMTVMLVGFVNSGIMELGQVVGVIMGTNIGTTITAWLFSMTGVDSSNFFIKLLNPTSFAPVLAFFGILMVMLSKSNKKKDIGSILIGFAILMYGMNTMASIMKPLASSPEFTSVMTMFRNPLLGVLVGALITAIIQSSSASVGILQALSVTGGLSYSMAIPIIMGQNIGTCITSLLSSIGTNNNAKRVAFVHIYFNVIGTVVWLSAYFGIGALIKLPFNSIDINPAGIAIVHSIFNIATTAILFPFSKLLEKLARATIRDKKLSEPEKFTMLDERLLLTPSFAIAECRNLTLEMARVAYDAFSKSMTLLVDKYNQQTADYIYVAEKDVDKYEDVLGTYLVKISSKELSDKDSKAVSMILHTIGDFERISDHAVNIVQAAKEIHDKGAAFSEDAKKELGIITDALSEILEKTITAFTENNIELAMQVEPLEQVIDFLRNEIKNRHIERLRLSKCTIEMGFILADILTNYERVSDHCSNIAIAVIQLQNASFEAHGYLVSVRAEENHQYINEFNDYLLKYNLNGK